MSYLRSFYERIGRRIKPTRKIDIISRKEQPIPVLRTKVGKLKFKDYELRPVSSSFITHIGYTIRGGLLRIVMNGRGYMYLDVPFKLFEEFYYAHSKGTFYNLKIKGQYSQVRFK